MRGEPDISPADKISKNPQKIIDRSNLKPHYIYHFSSESCTAGKNIFHDIKFKIWNDFPY